MAMHKIDAEEYQRVLAELDNARATCEVLEARTKDQREIITWIIEDLQCERKYLTTTLINAIQDLEQCIVRLRTLGANVETRKIEVSF